MKKKLMLTMILSGWILVLSLSCSAQTKPVKVLTAKDKALIIEIFKTLKTDIYYLEFNNGSETYGSGTGGSAIGGLKQGVDFSKSTHIYGAWYPEIAVLYCVSHVPNTAEAIFGKKNAAKLETVLSKYAVGKK